VALHIVILLNVVLDTAVIAGLLRLLVPASFGRDARAA